MRAAEEKEEEKEKPQGVFLLLRLSLVEQTEQGFLLQAASPLRVTGH